MPERQRFAQAGGASNTGARRQHNSGPLPHEKSDVPSDLTCKAVCDLRLVFATFQKNARATITLDQLADIIELLGDPRPTAEELTAISNISNEEIDFKQFVRFFVAHVRGGAFGVCAREVFRAMDCDDSGRVSAKELQDSLTSMGMSLNADEALAMTSVADTSREGEISYLQFRSILRRADSHAQLNRDRSTDRSDETGIQSLY